MGGGVASEKGPQCRPFVKSEIIASDFDSDLGSPNLLVVSNNHKPRLRFSYFGGYQDM